MYVYIRTCKRVGAGGGVSPGRVRAGKQGRSAVNKTERLDAYFGRMRGDTARALRRYTAEKWCCQFDKTRRTFFFFF